MSALEQKLSTLRDGTEAVAAVLGNWDGVLGVIGMAGARVQRLAESQGDSQEGDVNVKAEEEMSAEETKQDLPVTLVRIPIGEGKGTGEG
jgi:DASH complex subunit DAD2